MASAPRVPPVAPACDVVETSSALTPGRTHGHRKSQTQLDSAAATWNGGTAGAGAAEGNSAADGPSTGAVSSSTPGTPASGGSARGGGAGQADGGAGASTPTTSDGAIGGAAGADAGAGGRFSGGLRTSLVSTTRTTVRVRRPTVTKGDARPPVSPRPGAAGGAQGGAGGTAAAVATGGWREGGGDAMARDGGGGDTASRTNIDVSQLRALKAEFDAADDGFTEEEFVTQFAATLGGALTAQQLTALFQKIDANADGTVDWDEFTNFMFLSAKEHTSAEYIPRTYKRSLVKPSLRMKDRKAGARPRGDTTEGSEPGATETGDNTGRLTWNNQDMQSMMSRLDMEDLFRRMQSASDDATKRDEAAEEARKASGVADALSPPVVYASMPVDRAEAIEARISTSIALVSGTETFGASRIRPAGSLRGEFSPRLAPGAFAHNDFVIRIVFIPSPDRYVTVGSDGIICVWEEPRDGKLVYKFSFRTACQWLADACWMPLSQRLCTVSVDGTIEFYKFNLVAGMASLVSRIHGTRIHHSTPFCCHAYVAADGETEKLLIGDDTGALHIMSTKTRGWHACDGRLPSKCHKYEVVQGISIRRKQCHSKSGDNCWITKVEYVPDLDVIVTACMNGELNVYDAKLSKLHSQYVAKHGVLSFAWSPVLHGMALSTGDRQVVLWNPYSTKLMGTLPGHTAPVVQCCFDDDHYQMITLAKDMTLRVWDMRAQKVIQVVRDAAGIGSGARKWIPPMLVSPRTNYIITAARSVNVWPLVPLPGEKSTGADARREQDDGTPISSALYNNAFNIVVTHTGTTSSTVYIWDVDTGSLMSQFDKAHANEPITSIAFDRECRRLLTGSHIGDKLRCWNFNNGALLSEFTKDYRYEQAEEMARLRHAEEAEKVIEPLGGEKKEGDVPFAHLGRGRSRLDDGDEDDEDLDVEQRDEPVRVPVTAGSPVAARAGHRATAPATTATLGEVTLSGTLRPGTGGSAAEDIQPFREITQIVYVERVNEIVAGTTQSEGQKFICSIGCDGFLYVWQDNSEDEPPVGYIYRMPDEADRAKGAGHSQDILALSYCPPYTLATAGLDGTIHLWSLNTGKHMRRLFKGQPQRGTAAAARQDGPADTRVSAILERSVLEDNTPPIHALLYAPRLGLLITAGDEPVLRLFDVVSASMKQAYSLPQDEDASTVCIGTDVQNELLFTGDTKGNVTVWDVVGPEQDARGVGLLVPVAAWRAHDTRIYSLGCVEHARLMDIYVLTGSQSGTSLWTVAGQHVGQFGQHDPWALDRPVTYRHRRTHWVPHADMASGPGTAAASALPTPAAAADPDDFAALAQAALLSPRPPNASKYARLVDDAASPRTRSKRESLKKRAASVEVPQSGQVWIKIDQTHEQKRIDPLVYQVPDPNDEAALEEVKLGRITACITVVRVAKTSVIGWDGIEDDASRNVFIPLSEFTTRSVRSNDPWVHYKRASARVGRIFRGRRVSEEPPYEAVAAAEPPPAPVTEAAAPLATPLASVVTPRAEPLATGRVVSTVASPRVPESPAVRVQAPDPFKVLYICMKETVPGDASSRKFFARDIDLNLCEVPELPAASVVSSSPRAFPLFDQPRVARRAITLFNRDEELHAREAARPVTVPTLQPVSPAKARQPEAALRSPSHGGDEPDDATDKAAAGEVAGAIAEADARGGDGREEGGADGGDDVSASTAETSVPEGFTTTAPPEQHSHGVAAGDAEVRDVVSRGDPGAGAHQPLHGVSVTVRRKSNIDTEAVAAAVRRTPVPPPAKKAGETRRAEAVDGRPTSRASRARMAREISSTASQMSSHVPQLDDDMSTGIGYVGGVAGEEDEAETSRPGLKPRGMHSLTLYGQRRGKRLIIQTDMSMHKVEEGGGEGDDASMPPAQPSASSAHGPPLPFATPRVAQDGGRVLGFDGLSPRTSLQAAPSGLHASASTGPEEPFGVGLDQTSEAASPVKDVFAARIAEAERKERRRRRRRTSEQLAREREEAEAERKRREKEAEEERQRAIIAERRARRARLLVPKAKKEIGPDDVLKALPASVNYRTAFQKTRRDKLDTRATKKPAYVPKDFMSMVSRLADAPEDALAAEVLGFAKAGMLDWEREQAKRDLAYFAPPTHAAPRRREPPEPETRSRAARQPTTRVRAPRRSGGASSGDAAE